jgi:cysteine-rich repeat protein
LPGGFAEEAIGGGWDRAVGLTFASDGKLFVWEKAGRVWQVDSNGQRHGRPLIDISEEVGDWRDYGLLGVATSPNFATNGYIYLAYVVDYHHLKHFGTPNYDPSVNEYFTDTIVRITRYQASAADGFESVDPSSRKVLLGDTISSGCAILHQSHGVGSLVFGDDGTLLAACGDGASYDFPDAGGVTESNTGLADGIIGPSEDVGAFRAQLVNSLSGKILRLDPNTGDGVPGNPFYDAAAPRAARSRVWALGVRNPFRMTLRAGTGGHDPSAAQPGTLYFGDVGWDAREELNVVREPGQNFGWPLYEGMDLRNNYVAVDPGNKDAPNPLFGSTPAGQPPCTRAWFRFRDLLAQDKQGPATFPNPCAPSQTVPSSVPTFKAVRPSLDWQHVQANTRVPTFDAAGNATTALLGATGAPAGEPFAGACSVGGVWYTAQDFPEEYQNTYFHADYADGWIKNLVFDEQNQLIEVRPFVPAGQAPVVSMATSPVDGGLYYISYTDTVRRIRFVGGGNKPPVAAATSDVTYGPGPLTVNFDSAGSQDPELGVLAYEWDFGDGSAISTASAPTHVYSASDNLAHGFTAKLTVTDVEGATDTKELQIVINDTPPVVTIASPLTGGVFTNSSASSVTLSATAQDAEDPPGSLSCVWQTILHHNQHFHIESAVPGCTQQAHVTPVGCGDEVYNFEFRVTVQDSSGLKQVASSVLHPDCPSVPLAPSGTVSMNPTLSWRHLRGADRYEVVVDDSSGPGHVQATYTLAQAGCDAPNANTCSVSSPAQLALGAATIRVRAHNPIAGWRAWSDDLNFSVGPCGNADLDTGEGCDDGNAIDSDACSNDCVVASCADGKQNQQETGIDCGGPCGACFVPCASSPLQRAEAFASSVDGGLQAGLAIDGSSSTRWSSMMNSDPQWITVDLGARRTVNHVQLSWEAAASANYDIQVSNGANGPWTTVYNDPNGDGGLDDITGLNAVGRYVRMFSRARTTPYGNSLFDFAIYGDTNVSCGPPQTSCGNGVVELGEQCDDGNLVDDDTCSSSCIVASCADGALNQGETGVDCGGPCAACGFCGDGVQAAGEACDDGNSVDDDTCRNNCVAATCVDGLRNQGETAPDCGGPCSPCGSGGDCLSVALPRSSASASSAENGLVASLAIDTSASTRWSSVHADPQWLTVDLGALRRVRRVVLSWEAAQSADFDLEISNAAEGPWTKLYSYADAGESDFAGLNANGRYVRMYSRTRATAWGVSLFDFAVYGDTNIACGAPITTCGDGVVEGSEQCDDANGVNDDACSNSCQAPSCTDGIRNNGETAIDCGGPCTTCVVCGNGLVQGAEQCDDGNVVDDDDCSNACLQATCSDGRRNHGETAVDCGGPCQACGSQCSVVALNRSGATASSSEGSLLPGLAIDASATTRWGSSYADPQWLTVDLGATRRVKRVRLSWEAASSSQYDVQTSNGADGPWATVYSTNNGDGGVDDITDLNANARYVRMYSRLRATPYGNSLYDFAVYGDVNTSCGVQPTTCGDGILSPGEQCDDGNTVANDSCSSTCVAASCFDGLQNQAELGVDCGASCGACPICGDGVVETGEQCDDGNAINDDGCSNVCGLATCADDWQNQGETGIDCGGPCAACSSQCLVNPLQRVSAAASTDESSLTTAAFAIDGSAVSRWASASADPQWLRVDLGSARRIKRVVLRWEAAASRDYDIQVSDNAAGPWLPVYTDGDGNGGVDDVGDLNANARYVRMYSRARATPYGNSLWEFEVYGDSNLGCGVAPSICGDGVLDSGEECDDGNTNPDDTCTNICEQATCADGFQNQGETDIDCGGPCAACSTQCRSLALTRTAAQASSTESPLVPPEAASDGLGNTRWASLAANPQWLHVDLGAQRRIRRVVLRWEAAASRDYDIQLSDSPAGPWTTVYNDPAGDGGIDDVGGLNANARYVRMYSRQRNTSYGNSLWELEVYGDPITSCTP